jgi:hypothetical protein
MSAFWSYVYFRGGDHIIVDGKAEDVARVLTGDRQGQLVTIEGAAVIVNWSNVLYIREQDQSSPPLPA